MSFRIALSTLRENLVLSIEGEIDLSTADRLRGEIHDALSHQPQRLILDMTGVSFLDSTGLGALAGGLEQSEQSGTPIAVVCPPRLRKLFSITGLDAVLTVAESVEAACGDPVVVE